MSNTTENTQKSPVREAVDLAKSGNFKEALTMFRTVKSFKGEALGASYYAFCIALLEKNYSDALKITANALEQEFYNPDIFLNTARIYIIKGNKKMAIQAIRKGLSVNPGHSGLIMQIKKLGVRQKPFMPFLSRTNFINIVAGRVKFKMSARKDLVKSIHQSMR